MFRFNVTVVEAPFRSKISVDFTSYPDARGKPMTFSFCSLSRARRLQDSFAIARDPESAESSSPRGVGARDMQNARSALELFIDLEGEEFFFNEGCMLRVT